MAENTAGDERGDGEVIPPPMMNDTPSSSSLASPTTDEWLIPLEALLVCQFGSWYSACEKFTFPSKIIPLEPAVVEYLNADGVFLPTSAAAERGFGGDSADEDDSVEWDPSPARPAGPTFTELEGVIAESIRALGGSVMPKLNWSAPKDAAWISFSQSMKVATPADVFLLLKASDFISHDLVDVFEKVAGKARPEDFQYTLVLRQWNNIQPSMEFRCFVKKGVFIACCQRDAQSYYPHLVERTTRLAKTLLAFWTKKLKSKMTYPNYVFDAYIDENEYVWLVDINAWGPMTDPLLFTWKELRRNFNQRYHLRVLTESAGVGPSLAMTSRLPKDLQHFGDLVGSDPSTKEGLEALIAAMREGRLDDAGTSSTDDDQENDRD